MYSYGLIGNCQTSSLVHENGSIDWLCFPRPDSPPVFGRILDPDGGHFSIEGVGNYRSEQSYLPSTAVLVTTFTSDDGSRFRITDFSPRFYQHGRTYRPNAVFRKVEPLAGTPVIRVQCRPVDGWTKRPVRPIRGNSHLGFQMRDDDLRLVTNMPLTHLTEERPLSLKEPLYFGLTWSFGVEADLVEVTNRFLALTLDYWKTWVKHCSIPTLYQKETIRSALTLKLHCYEDTGAILAGTTTSLPEEFGHNRNWDYRFCWLRDSYFALTAFQNLGHFEEMEGFLKFLLNIVDQRTSDVLHPVYKLDHSLPLPEIEQPGWSGYAASRPVRQNNQAAEHVQNDVYGEMVLALSPIFFDERFQHLRSRDHQDVLAELAKSCNRNISKPDAGLWELRKGWREHSFSNLMCWAGLERVERIQQLGYLKSIDFNVTDAKLAAEAAVRKAVHAGVLTNGPDDQTLDASLLLAANLRFPEQDVNRETVLEIQRNLKVGSSPHDSSFLYRYRRVDDFGRPQSAFLICSFWLVEALARIGLINEAREVMANAVSSGNRLGLLSEHYLACENQQSGNFPQAYSHIGQINAAFAISPPWNEIL